MGGVLYTVHLPGKNYVSIVCCWLLKSIMAMLQLDND